MFGMETHEIRVVTLCVKERSSSNIFSSFVGDDRVNMERTGLVPFDPGIYIVDTSKTTQKVVYCATSLFIWKIRICLL